MKDDECQYSHSKNVRNESSPPTTSAPKSVTVTKGIGPVVLKPSVTSGSLPNTSNDSQPSNKDLELRMARMESRLVQLMIHFGLDPQEKRYG
jgi:hypothetical protein